MPPGLKVGMVKHPEQLGFKLGLRIHIGKPASVTTESPDAKTVRDVVYVALLTKNIRPLKKGDAIRVGQTGGTLMRRWLGIAGIFNRAHVRQNEQRDRERLLQEADGKEVFVWMKKAGKIKIPYTKGLTQSDFSSRGRKKYFLMSITSRGWVHHWAAGSEGRRLKFLP